MRAVASLEMSRRDRLLLLALAALSVVLVVVHSLLGLDPNLLLAVPALVMFLPLLAGRYVGEDGLARLAARWRARRPRALASCGRALRAPVVLPRGGRLIAAALAQRGPPASLLAR
jgi:hypothetical protein